MLIGHIIGMDEQQEILWRSRTLSAGFLESRSCRESHSESTINEAGGRDDCLTKEFRH